MSIHDRKVVASLKPPDNILTFMQDSGIHDRKVVASLKQNSKPDGRAYYFVVSMTERSWPH